MYGIIFFLSFILGCMPCNAKQVYVERGDIVLWIDEAVKQDSPEYADQVRLAYLQAAGKAAGIYDPIDPDLKTWDNTNTPLIHCRSFCIHIDLMTYSGEYQYTSDYLVVLRPTPHLLHHIDMDAAIGKKLEVDAHGVTYNQPELYIVMKWWELNPTETTLWVNDEAKDHWFDIYGIDCSAGLRAAQWSPCVGQDCHYDIACPSFWLRDMNCSTSAWWYLQWGYFKRGAPDLGNWMIEHKDFVDASDCMAPGLVAEYLVRHKFATILHIHR
jgi:hypothetical protein